MIELAERDRADELAREEFKRTGQRQLVTWVGEVEFTYDPNIVLAAFLESRISPTGRIPSLDEIMSKNLDFLRDVHTMSRFYQFFYDYGDRSPEMQ